MAMTLIVLCLASLRVGLPGTTVDDDVINERKRTFLFANALSENLLWQLLLRGHG